MSEDSSSVLTWRPGTFKLTFRLGVLRLCTARFRSIEPVEHFSRWPDDPSRTGIPYEKFKQGVETIVLRSHPVERPLPRLSFRNGAIWYSPSTYHHYYVDLRMTFDEYLAHFSPKSRSTLVRKVRKFFAEWPESVKFRVFKQPGEMEEFHQLARQVSEKSYQERLLDAGIPGSEAYLAELKQMAEADSVRGYVLTVGSDAVAYLCLPAHDGVLMYEYLGHDPQHVRLSPGTVLQHLALEALFAEQRFDVLDFEEGEGQHKESFSTGSRTCADLFVFARRPWALVLVLSHHALSRTVAGLFRVADATGLRTRIRQWVRR